MNLDRVLSLVAFRWRSDFETFLETGVAGEEFTDVLNKDKDCQNALDIFLEFDETILQVHEHRRRITKFIKPYLKMVDPKWHVAFTHFFNTGEYSHEFAKYIESDLRCQEAMEKIVEDFKAEVDRIETKLAKQASKKIEVLSPAMLYTREIESHRQRWLALDDLATEGEEP